MLAAVEQAITDQNLSVSGYLRMVLIRDLRIRGLLPDSILADLTEVS